MSKCKAVMDSDKVTSLRVREKAESKSKGSTKK